MNPAFPSYFTIGLLFIVNVGTLVWGASRLSTTVRFQGQVLKSCTEDLKDVAALVNGHEVRLVVLEDRMEV